MAVRIGDVVVLTDFWNHRVLEAGREGIFVALSGFLASFLFIRTSTGPENC